jgi:O-antigen/teichoic acid export membrane protein
MVRAANTLLGFLVAMLLARALGVSGYGVYSYVLTLVSILAIPAKMGLPGLTVREVARSRSTSAWGELRGIIRWGNTMAGGFSIALIAIGAGVAAAISGWFTPEQLATFAWGLALVPFMVLGELRGAALRGLGHVIQGQLPEMILRPGFLGLSCALLLLVSNTRFGPDLAMALHALAALLAFAVGAYLFFRCRPQPVAAAEPVYHRRAWLAAALPMAFTAGVQFLNHHVDMLILGVFATADQVGIYRAAVQLSALVGVTLMAMNQVVAPRFAALYARGDFSGLQKLATNSARLVLAVAVPLTLIMVVFGDRLLGGIFGPDFAGGHLPLALLAVGQLLNSAFGSVVMLLNMSGHESRTARGVAIAALVGLALNFLLVPTFGAAGAALATTLTILLWNVILWLEVRRSLGIDSTALRPRGLRR